MVGGCVDCIAEHHDLNDRQDENDCKGPPIPGDLDELLPDDRRYPAHSSSQASTGMPGFRPPSELIFTFTPKTRARRSFWVWTLRGVNSAFDEMLETVPCSVRPGRESVRMKTGWPILTPPMSRSRT